MAAWSDIKNPISNIEWKMYFMSRWKQAKESVDRLMYSRLHNNVSSKHYEKRETKGKKISAIETQDACA